MNMHMHDTDYKISPENFLKTHLHRVAGWFADRVIKMSLGQFSSIMHPIYSIIFEIREY